MLMGEQPNETKVESTQWCPKCGASLENAGARPEIEPGTETCDVCGAPLVALQTNFTPAPLAIPPVEPTAPPRHRNPLALVVVALVAAGMLYFGFHTARRSGTDHPLGVGYGTPAPDFTLETLDGKSVTLSSLRGKAVVVNFWATWCGPCKIETPWLVELQNQYGAQGLQIVGVAMDDSGKDEIARFAKDMGMNYPVVLGKEAVGQAYGGVDALPESFFIGRDGKIVDKIMGLEGRSEIEDAIKKALNTEASGNPAATARALIDPK
ncbi:MAG TPA: TlpA disulfide reductase family protein [Candidatus Sulfotelmatobacter sp.]|nr:TlpA disulfide reductase family protein [Candidatus Sulfotelmatobacter sp.]